MPTQKDTQSQIARKVNFAIQLLRETAELLKTSPKSTFVGKRSRYPRRQTSVRATSSAQANRHLTVPVFSCLKRK
jgi:hypothetical protein